MKNFKNYILYFLFAIVLLAGCGSGNEDSSIDKVPDNPTVSDSPRANQPNGYAPPNTNGEDSASNNDSLRH